MSRDSVWQRLMGAIGAQAPAKVVAEPGLHSYERLEGEWPTRFHLRVDPDGGGLLLANASEAAYLSPVGVLMARGLLDRREEAEILRQVTGSFGGTSAAQMAADLQRVGELIEDLSRPGDNYPITDLGDPSRSVWERQMAAPLRAALTQGPPEVMREILRRLWEAGVPHVSIVASPEAPADDLPQIAEAAGDLGMICGLRAVASGLTPQVIQQAAQAGLDHLDLLYVSPQPQRHDALLGPGDHRQAQAAFAQCRELELCPVAVMPLMAANAADLGSDLHALAGEGLTNLVCFALACPDDDEAAQQAGALPARALPQVALELTETAEEGQTRFLWAPPVRYDPRLTLAEQVARGPRTASDMAVRVEPDGSVLPPRGPRVAAGSLLEQPWEQIWAHPSFERYRELLGAPTRCADCPDLPLCNADCPRDPAGWSDDTQGGEPT